MKKIKSGLLFIALLFSAEICAEFTPFSFVQLSDIHISPHNDNALNDLRQSVCEILCNDSIAFVIVSGDITDAGEIGSMRRAKQILDSIQVPVYVTSGNHETKWSESGCTDFNRVFGSDRFCFSYNDCLFFGFGTGPIIKMADGHVAPQDVIWIDSLLRNSDEKYIFPVTHYPLQNGDVDNWYELTDIFRQYNVQCVLGGHYHRNLLFSCDGIADVLARSNLRGKENQVGYTIVSVRSDSIRWQEKPVGKAPVKWLSLPLDEKAYPAPDPDIRPDYSVNDSYKYVRERWQAHLQAEIYAAPVVWKNHVYVGEDNGNFYCINLCNGKPLWKYHTKNRIISTAAVAEGKVVFGSTDGCIYCLDARKGTLVWKLNTDKAVMGCAVIEGGVVYIGGSDGCFRAIDLNSGTPVWTFRDVKGYIETKPCIYADKIYFGAWDCNFYALNLSDGTLAWKWNNSHPSDKYSPAACWPVASDGKIFFTAPDRVFTCLNAETGEVVWRTKEHVVRETVGISTDGKKIFSRCMWDYVVAMDATADSPVTLWNTNAHYDYDHNPSMLIEKGGVVVFGTKNGLLHGINADTGEIIWKHKIDNSVINTVYMLSKKDVIVTSANGTVTRLRITNP
ncbi:MAG: PQQ-binding-like beta-propeller repeat protein [Paludibacteraceae bacterium]|nr:PQQ-binding-like beta-propeller repeat protein [Paludibacteraceae bacterium]